jgi:hypothetical protein
MLLETRRAEPNWSDTKQKGAAMRAYAPIA